MMAIDAQIAGPGFGPPVQGAHPPMPPGASPADFMIAVYTQLGQIQRDIGSLTAAQRLLSEQMANIEPRLETRIGEVETRLETQIKESEGRVTTRLSSLEAKHVNLEERVSRVFLMSAGAGLVVGATVGWRPILSWIGQTVGFR